MPPIPSSLASVLFPVKKEVEFRKPRGYKNVSSTEMIENVKNNNNYCVIS